MTVNELREKLEFFPSYWEVTNANGDPIQLGVTVERYFDATGDKAIYTPSGLVIK